jgi:putative SOS response-associated peptidase YedK
MARRPHQRLVSAYPADLMEAFAVSTAVNRAGRDAPEMMEQVAG